MEPLSARRHPSRPSARRAFVGVAAAAATVVAALTVIAFAAPLPAGAFSVEDRGTAGLDGKVVMSPAAERVETVRPDGGAPVAPGATVQRAIILHNRTEAPIDFDLDVAQVVGSSAELIVEVRHGVREGAAAWVTLERPSVSLKPGQQATIGVTVEVPRSVKPGSKPFAVTATQRSAPVQTEGAGIAPQFKQVGIFIIELPGDAPQGGRLTRATITSAQKSLEAARSGERSPTNSRLYVGPDIAGAHRLTLSTEYRNSGERLLTPSGRVTVRDVFGRVAGRFDVPRFTVYPDGANAGTVELKGLPSLGLFRATVELESDAGEQRTVLPRFVMVPKWFLAALAAFVLYGAWRLVQRIRRRRAEWQAYIDDEDVAGDLDGDDYAVVDDEVVDDDGRGGR